MIGPHYVIGISVFILLLGFFEIVVKSPYLKSEVERTHKVEEVILTLLLSLPGAILFRSLSMLLLSLLFFNLLIYVLKKKKKARFLATLNRELPFLALSISLLIEGGCSVQSSLSKLHESYPGGPSKAFLGDMKTIFDMGIDAENVKGEISRLYRSEGADLFLEIMITGKDLGSGPGTALKDLCEKMVRERVTKAEEHALKAPVKLMVPLCLFIFPAIFLLIFSPVVFQLWGMIR